MIKKDPIYRVTVIYTNDEGKSRQLIIQLPFTCQFSVTRSVHADSCRAHVQLYNLAPQTRNEIFQDIFTLEEKKWKYLHIEAGYGGDYDNMNLIFKGRILQAYSHKSGGSTDIITEIQAQAFDLLDCYTSRTFVGGTSFKEIYSSLAQDLPNCVIGNTGALEGNIKTSTTFDGNTLDELNKLSGGNTFIDNGVLNTILNNEVIDVPVPSLWANTGLLETPMRRDASLIIKSIFIPELIVAQLLEIKADVLNNYNGQYKVLGFTHNCLFSETQAGSRTTEIELWIGPLLPGAEIVTTDNKVENNFNKVKGNKVQPVVSNVPLNIRELYQKIKKNNGIVPNLQLTKNINWREVLVNDNEPADIVKDLTLEKLTNVYYTAIYFQSILDKYFPGHTVKINSGFRTIVNNTKVKGETDSKHLVGLAIDFRINGVSLEEQRKIFKKVWIGRVITNYATFTHVQLGSIKGFINDK